MVLLVQSRTRKWIREMKVLCRMMNLTYSLFTFRCQPWTILLCTIYFTCLVIITGCGETQPTPEHFREDERVESLSRSAYRDDQKEEDGQYAATTKPPQDLGVPNSDRDETLLAMEQARVVERIKSLGGFARHDKKYAVTTQPSQDTGVSNGKPTFRPVNAVEFGALTKVTDDDLVCLESLPDLHSIVFIYAKEISDRGLYHLRNAMQLEKLYLLETKVTGVGLDHLHALHNLTDLTLADSPVTDAGLIHLQSLPNLQKLYLSCPNITESGLESLVHLKQLRELVIFECEITDAGAKILAKIPNLQSMHVCGYHMTDEGCKTLGDMQNLRVVKIFGNLKITNVGLRELSRISDIEEIHLFSCDISDAGLACLEHLQNLRSLTVEDSRIFEPATITDAGLPHLYAIPNLEELHLQNDTVTSTAMWELIDKKQLRRASLHRVFTTENGERIEFVRK